MDKIIYSKNICKTHIFNGTWEYKNNRISFTNFIPNDSTKFLAQSYHDATMGASLPVTFLFGVMIEENSDLGHYYLKIK